MDTISSIDTTLIEWVDEKIPLRRLEVGERVFSYRVQGPENGPVIALLHGIGSASGSWAHQLGNLSGQYRVVAWDAPGYGASSSLLGETPSAADYAAALGDFFAGMNVVPEILIGHSLGALMAGAYAGDGGIIGKALILANPANGYGAAEESIRNEKLSARLGNMEKLGPEGLADARASALLSDDASPEALEMVRWNMSKLRIEGHAQAAHMLAGGNLISDAQKYSGRVLVMCGAEDTVTPEAGCRKIADAYPNAEYLTLPGVGHASYVENPDQFDQFVLDFVGGGDA